MCYLITVAVRSRHGQRLIDAMANKLGSQQQKNASIIAALGRRDMVTRSLSNTGCCCGWYSPYGRRDKRENEIRKKGARLKWSSSRIRRALEAATADLREGLSQDVRTAVADLAEAAGEVALIVHWYEGHADEDLITLGQGRPLPAKSLRDGAVIPEDQVIWIAG